MTFDLSNEKRIDILLVESESDEATWIQGVLLRQKGINCQVTLLESVSSAIDYLRDHIPDVIVLDFALPHAPSLQTALEIRGESSLIPLIVLTRVDNDSTAREVMHLAPDNYLSQSEMTEVALMQHIQSGVKSHQALLVSSEANRHFRVIANRSPVLMWEMNIQGRYTFFNKACHAFSGNNSNDSSSSWWQDGIYAEDIERYRDLMASSIKEQHAFQIEYRAMCKDGEYHWILDTGTPSFDSSNIFLGLLGSAVDITDKKIAEESAIDWKQRYVMAIDSSGKVLFEWSSKTNEVKFGGSCEVITGFDPEEITGGIEKWFSLIHPDEQKAVMAAFAKAKYEGEALDCEYRLRCNDGHFINVLHSAKIVKDDTSQSEKMIGFISDVSGQVATNKKLEEGENRYRTLVSNIPGAVYHYIYDRHAGWSTDFLSDEILNITGYPSSYFSDNDIQAFTQLVHEDDMELREQAINQALQDDCAFGIDYRIRDKSGCIRWIREQGRITLDRVSGRMWLDGVLLDSTDRTMTKKKLDYVVYHDSLTGLPNRMLFLDRLGQAVIAANHDHEQLAVLAIDVDHFKRINDTLGHSSGDKLLQSMAGRISEVLYDTDTVTRDGGDEFLVLITGLKRPAQALAVADKVFNVFQKAFFIDEHELFMTCSIGISIYPTDGFDIDSLLKNADTAMNRAKDQGRNNYQLYTPTMNDKALRKLKLENQLRHALEREELRIHYQPQVSIKTNHIIGMEALLRWNHPELGNISPAEFIPLAEDSGLIVPIGEWVLTKVCAQVKEWEEMGLLNIRVCVNMSARQFRQKNFAECVIAIIRESHIDSESIEFELTEGTIMKDWEETIAAMNQIKAHGMRISIDDFGTGYSSLSRLKKLPLDAIKIDQSFVRDIPDDLDDSAIAEAIISMGNSMNLEVIAEGVESEAQLSFLRDKGCGIMQGFLFSRAIPPIDMTKLLIKDTASD
ncbi:MAG: diguanylate cyclase (GGDEF)-like protein/PAS domain S-box-containing protein [Candidatus Omnitrophota bacterium]|jgi:diguanylate cyclase (GGDEF)-like protein/PAS domain S-box-containing protein